MKRLDILDLINEVDGFKTSKSWEYTTMGDRVEERARKALSSELFNHSNMTKSEMREIIPWRIKEIRKNIWEQIKKDRYS